MSLTALATSDNDDHPSSRYAAHPDVSLRNGGAYVRVGSGRYLIQHMGDGLGWCIYFGDTLTLVAVEGGGFATNAASMDDAIDAVLGVQQ